MAELMPATQVKQAITNYYSGDTVWDDWSAQIQATGITETQIWEAINEYDNTKAIEVMKSIDGKVLGYGYAQNIQASDIDSSVNSFINNMDSNITPGEFSIDTTVQTRINPSIFKDQSTGDITMKSGAFKTNPSTGVVSTVATVADKVALGVQGVNIGAKLGRMIDESIYNIDPDWWNKNYPTINPETWDSIATSQGGKSFVRSLFGIEGNTATMYVDEDMLAYTYQMLRDLGALSDVSYDGSLNDRSSLPDTFANIESITVGSGEASFINRYNQQAFKYSIPGSYGYSYLDGTGTYVVIFLSDTILSGTLTTYYPNTGETVTTQISTHLYGRTYNTDKLYYYYVTSIQPLNQHTVPPELPNNLGSNIKAIATYLFDGDITQNGIEGSTTIPDSTQYPPTNITGTTPQQVKQQRFLSELIFVRFRRRHFKKRFDREFL